jgi:hypothetical protein
VRLAAVVWVMSLLLFSICTPIKKARAGFPVAPVLLQLILPE